MQVPRRLWHTLRRIHRAAAARRRARAAVRAASAVAMLTINVALAMLMAGGFDATAANTTQCTRAAVLYALTYGLIAVTVALDWQSRQRRRKLHQLVLCLQA